MKECVSICGCVDMCWCLNRLKLPLHTRQGTCPALLMHACACRQQLLTLSIALGHNKYNMQAYYYNSVLH